ncbi:MAG TPA: hypothetical protein VNU26_12230 [Mycobacteriales bacterium]|nr:hypothetical protein [Mycobacteriales bacterium]
MALVVHACRSLCQWAPTGSTTGGLRLFACAGCGSEWVRTEPWSPRQADGSWPPGVREELASSGPGAGAAGSAGS